MAERKASSLKEQFDANSLPQRESADESRDSFGVKDAKQECWKAGSILPTAPSVESKLYQPLRGV